MLADDHLKLMQYKEMYLPDGDLHTDGSGRFRRFHWKHSGANSFFFVKIVICDCVTEIFFQFLFWFNDGFLVSGTSSDCQRCWCQVVSWGRVSQ